MTGTYSSYYDNCILCPRGCGVNRNSNRRGFCKQDAHMVLASATLHKGEEPPVSGKNGSGALFFTGCTLKCSFCQNHQISRQGAGRQINASEFASVCRRLSDAGAETLNIVTGTHFIPSILEGMALVRSEGIDLPLVWNTSGYESDSGMDLLSDHVDIWLADLKTVDPDKAERWFGTADYVPHAKHAVKRMAEHVKQSGSRLILRHLVMPGYIEETREVLSWFCENAADAGELSLMVQYLPPKHGTDAPSRGVNEFELEDIYSMLERLEISDGFIQDIDPDEDQWLPDFTRYNPFPEEYSTPVWHYSDQEFTPDQ